MLTAASARADTSFTDPHFESTTLASGLDFPTTVTWAPDGRMFIAEKFGYVRVVQPDGTLLANPIIDISDHVVNSGDRGLLGLAAAPASGGNVTLYMLYTKRATTETDNQAADTTLDADSTLTSVTVHADNSVAGGTGTDGNVDPTEHVILGSAGLSAPASTSGDTAQGCVHETDDCIPSEGYTHTIGTVQVDPKDGSLWVGTGDGYSDGAYTDNASAPYHLRAQDSDSLAGKILHVHTDGTGYTGSPFCLPPATSTTANCSKVWAKGFRNPFRFTLRKLSNGTYQPVGGDVGEGNWEELNDVSHGYNGGWPCWEGNVQATGSPYGTSTQCMTLASNYNHAFYLFDHYEDGSSACVSNCGGAIVGGPVYTGSTYPPSYQGKVFSTDYVHGWILYHNLSTTGNPELNTSTFLDGDPLGRGVPYVSLQQAPDGNLVDVQIYGDPTNPAPASGSVQEIKYFPTNKAPIAQASVPSTCTTSQTVQFTGDSSTDPEGDQLTFVWDFGDGHTTTTVGLANANVSHTYANPGTYEVRLKVTDSHGNSNNAFLTLNIGPGDSPPNASISAPTIGSGTAPNFVSADQYVAGKQITMSGGTTSGAGSQMSWEPVLDHGGTHTHVLGVIPTPTGDVPDLPDGVQPFIADPFHGADSHYLLRFTVTKNGCSTTYTETMYPQTGSYEMDGQDQSAGGGAIPVPLTFVHTSIPETAPAPNTVTVAKNAIATATAPATWIHNGYTYTFDHWSGTPAPTTPTQPSTEIQPFSDDLSKTSESITAFYNRSDQPPTASIASPANGSAFSTGKPLTVTSGSSDPEDGILSHGSLAWTVSRTAHGATTPITTGSGSSIPLTPNANGDLHATYTITLKATDSHGLTDSTSITLHAGNAKVTLASDPRGVKLKAGSTDSTTPFTLGPFISGSPLAIQAPMTAKMRGVRYEFAAWSDGGARSHTFTVPIANTTLTASYAPPPHASLSHSRLRKPRTLSGKIAGGVMPIAHMSVALRPSTVTGKGCIWWSVKKHKLVRSSKGCGTPSLLTAKLSVTRGATHWSLKLGAALQPGSYVLLSQVRDRTGLVSKGAALKFTVTR